MTAEENGKPGRGLGIDVQNDIFAMQVYAYDSDGRPAFFTAVGAMSNNQVSTQMLRHQGGPSFGSGPRQAVTVGSVGNVTVRFTDGVSGFVTFPGEPEKAISRLNFGYAATASNLKGSWALTTFTPYGWVAEVPLLQTTLSSGTYGNGLVATADARYGCENQTSGSYAGQILCIKVTSSGALDKVYIFKNSVNEGEGNWWPGNSNVGYALYVKRLITPSANITGLFRSSEEVVTEGIAPLQAHLNALGAQAAAR
ncbi:hypothetical protein PSQ20_07015 [Curvibacter sp. RS43]|uniref:hypothetical protein n=1 Tax=Curvibacter microcysteis TaxID=3026419 RepID=UPI00235EEE4F|nr:hypothetical protein [Curvibacter sp. RS43]MDD0810081.1 hypothetical protein [Curvibacter sp. RS43]